MDGKGLFTKDIQTLGGKGRKIQIFLGCPLCIIYIVYPFLKHNKFE